MFWTIIAALVVYEAAKVVVWAAWTELARPLHRRGP